MDPEEYEVSAITTIMDELYRVRAEVLRRQDRGDTKFAVYYGRKAEREMALDPEVRMWAPIIDTGKRWPQTIMGALLQADYGLPEFAIRIDVDGKPYTTFSVEPPPS